MTHPLPTCTFWPAGSNLSCILVLSLLCPCSPPATSAPPGAAPTCPASGLIPAHCEVNIQDWPGDSARLLQAASKVLELVCCRSCHSHLHLLELLGREGVAQGVAVAVSGIGRDIQQQVLATQGTCASCRPCHCTTGCQTNRDWSSSRCPRSSTCVDGNELEGTSCRGCATARCCCLWLCVVPASV